MKTTHIILILLVCLGICVLIKYAFFLVLLCLGVLIYRAARWINDTKRRLHRTDDGDINDKYHYTER